MQIIVDNDIYIREVALSDADDIFNMINSNREHLRIWLPFVDFTQKVDDTKKFINSVINQSPKKKDYVFVIHYKKKPVGLIGLKGIDYANKKTEIGYWLIKDAEGKGIVTRSVLGLMKYTFNNLAMNRIMIRFAVGNTRSATISERLGYFYEGIERDGEFINGKFHDLKVYSILKTEFNR